MEGDKEQQQQQQEQSIEEQLHQLQLQKEIELKQSEWNQLYFLVFRNKYIHSHIYRLVDSICRLKGGHIKSEYSLYKQIQSTVTRQFHPGQFKKLFLELKDRIDKYEKDHPKANGKPSLPLDGQTGVVLSMLVQRNEYETVEFLFDHIQPSIYMSNLYDHCDIRMAKFLYSKGIRVINIDRIIKMRDFPYTKLIIDPILEQDRLDMQESLKTGKKISLIRALREPGGVVKFRKGHFINALSSCNLETIQYLHPFYRERLAKHVVKIQNQIANIGINSPLRQKTDIYNDREKTKLGIKYGITDVVRNGRDAAVEILEYLKDNDDWDIFGAGSNKLYSEWLGVSISMDNSTKLIKYLYKQSGLPHLRDYIRNVISYGYNRELLEFILSNSIDQEDTDIGNGGGRRKKKGKAKKEISTTKVNAITLSVISSRHLSLDLIKRLEQLSPYVELNKVEILFGAMSFPSSTMFFELTNYFDELEGNSGILFITAIQSKKMDQIEFILENKKKIQCNLAIPASKLVSGIKTQDKLQELLNLLHKYMNLSRWSFIDYESLLNHSIVNGYLEVVKFLFELNNYKLKDKITPILLQLASRNNHYDIVRYLCEEKGLSKCSKECFLGCSLPVLRYIYERFVMTSKENGNAIVYNENGDVYFDFLYTIKYQVFANHLDCVKYLIQLHPDKRGLNLEETIEPCIRSGSLEMLRFIDCNFNISYPKHLAESAAQYGNKDAIIFLTEGNKCEFSSKVIDTAAIHGNLSIVQYLNENRREKCTFSGISKVVTSNYFEIFQYIVNNVITPQLVEKLTKKELKTLITRALDKSYYDRYIPMIYNHMVPSDLKEAIEEIFIKHAIQYGDLWTFNYFTTLRLAKNDE